MTSPTAQSVPAGWQVVLADLSLILFIATASAVATQPPPTPANRQTTQPPQEVFSSLAKGEDIGAWLADYTRDPRERLRITVHYRRGEFLSALKRAEAVGISATGLGHQPLITLEEHAKNQTTATFAFEGSPEQAGAQLARGLQ